jgi:hypothetical protein
MICPDPYPSTAHIDVHHTIPYNIAKQSIVSGPLSSDLLISKAAKQIVNLLSDPGRLKSTKNILFSIAPFLLKRELLSIYQSVLAEY